MGSNKDQNYGNYYLTLASHGRFTKIRVTISFYTRVVALSALFDQKTLMASLSPIPTNLDVYMYIFKT